ncbi:hypothetical protein Trydic_g12969 [Trypoxylus dichotomus]
MTAIISKYRILMQRVKRNTMALEPKPREFIPAILPGASHRGKDNIKLPTMAEVSRYSQLAAGDEAAKTIVSIGLTAENYDEACKFLIAQYNNKQYIVNSHLQALFDIPVTTKESASCLRNLVTDAKQHLRSLKCLGLPTDSWEDITVIHFSPKVRSRNMPRMGIK